MFGLGRKKKKERDELMDSLQLRQENLSAAIAEELQDTEATIIQCKRKNKGPANDGTPVATN